MLAPILGATRNHRQRPKVWCIDCWKEEDDDNYHMSHDGHVDERGADM